MKFSDSNILRDLSINLILIVFVGLIIEITMGRWFGSNSLRDFSIPISQPHSYDTSKIYAGGKIIQYKTDRNGFRGTHTQHLTPAHAGVSRKQVQANKPAHCADVNYRI
ncbi:MAG: hypothetical protein VB913_14610 [Rhodospirillales bacterium]